MTINKCKGSWATQLCCGDCAADGKPKRNGKGFEDMPNCWAKDGACRFQVKVEVS